MDLKSEFIKKIVNIISTDNYQSQKQYIQHRNVSVYKHQINVAFMAYKLMHNKKCDLDSLIIAALLHDYFLYDWHNFNDKNHKRFHGFRHASVAASNAVRDYNVSRKVVKLIRCHMWPLNLFHIPLSLEAIVLWHCDNVVSLKEIFLKGDIYDLSL